jgi:hypothetical protein
MSLHPVGRYLREYGGDTPNGCFENFYIWIPNKGLKWIKNGIRIRNK